MENQPEHNRLRRKHCVYTSIGSNLALGIGVGVAIGLALNNLALGIAIGLAIYGWEDYDNRNQDE